jgi:hypothetical protein
MKHIEQQNQIDLIKWASYHPHIFNSLFHIANQGKMNVITGAKLKKMGRKAGVWDLFLTIPASNFHGLFIEMKTEKGKLTKEQITFRENIEPNGYCFFIADNWEKAKDFILKYLSNGL